MRVVETINLSAKNMTGAIRTIRAETGNKEMPLLGWDVTFPNKEIEDQLKKFFTTKRQYGGPETGASVNYPTESTFFFMAALCELQAKTGIEVLWHTAKEEIQKED